MGTLKINTTRFGDIEVDEQLVLNFKEPILGFENENRFVILDHAEDSPFKWLQSADTPELAFVITNPKLFGMDYDFVLPQPIADQLSIKKAEEVLVVTIVNIPQGNPGQMTANLLGPIVINETNRQAVQFVLSDSEYSTKTRLIPDEVLDKKPSPSGVSAEQGE